LFFAMEFLEGETLTKVIEREKQLPIERAVDILTQICEGLTEAHGLGYIHRDLRPRTVFLITRRGRADFVKLLDFGLAKLILPEAEAKQTAMGMTFGDPRYMSPEQARGDKIDRRADIYQLGCIAYELLTGAPPFSGTRVFDILTKQVTEAPVPLPTKRAGVSLWMEAAVARMLAKDPDNRFATTTRMVEALRRGLETGEVMDDEIARRRESIPPPSVSRVMQKMGIPLPKDTSGPLASDTMVGVGASKSAPVPAPVSAPVSAPVPAPVATAPSAPVPARVEDGPSLPASAAVPMAKAPAPSVIAAPGVGSRTAVGSAPLAAAFEQLAPAPAPAPALEAPKLEAPKPEAPKPEAPKPVADSVELLRKRTGTPRVLPTVAAVEAAVEPEPEPRNQQPVSGLIEPAFTSSMHGKKPATGPTAEPGTSQAWFDEGDDDDKSAVRKKLSGSTADIRYDDEELPKRRRWGLWLGAAGVLLAGGIALAVTHGSGSGSTAEAPPPAPAAPAPSTLAVNAPPSTIIGDDPGAPPAPAPAPTPPPPVPTSPSIAARPAPTTPGIGKVLPVAHPAAPTYPAHPAGPANPAHPATPGGESYEIGGGDVSLHRPAGSPAPTPPAPTPVVEAPKPPTPATPPPHVTPAVSGGPSDPYGAGDPAPAGDGGDKKSEFFANLGQQQLDSGDTVAAAASFKKALELDPKSLAGVTGMGEIAVRQGLFGDAIAHLTRASRMAPKSDKVQTLLGEAYLGAGNNAQAAASFKKALQLNPENARARDGYEEASARVPPPTDDAP
ncbi:MAG TPA: protein kinase, partial [Kofleriaceae bacterium]